jgi:hypothetical protein
MVSLVLLMMRCCYAHFSLPVLIFRLHKDQPELPLSIFVGNWNMSGTKPSDSLPPLQKWLTSVDGKRYDIYVLAAQVSSGLVFCSHLRKFSFTKRLLIVSLSQRNVHSKWPIFLAMWRVLGSLHWSVVLIRIWQAPETKLTTGVCLE